MDANPTIARPAYFLAALFVALPMFDVVASVWPFHPALEQWRFGAVGALSNYTLLPLAGLLLGVITARTNNHRIFRRILGWLCALFAAVLVGVVLLFIMDYLQTKNIVHQEYRHAMAIATATASGKLICTILTLAMLAPAGITGPKRVWKEPGPGEREATPLIPILGSTRSE